MRFDTYPAGSPCSRCGEPATVRAVPALNRTLEPLCDACLWQSGIRTVCVYCEAYVFMGLCVCDGNDASHAMSLRRDDLVSRREGK